ncbi:MAG: transcriptional regulator [Cytophagales bacterium CG12_big_fil_rev_8_21_14_0_65_40_12]|nr:MAG: transcriptional regulator [Cytophagales bacterium CG12_big_fil_rev_8_21_14_0_65_40_12]PIW05180.1 MAG: transcriptional regulator [Cytophagales bacterium CG17_big_fil_post_rev_8_21_14_2_50_40_13]
MSIVSENIKHLRKLQKWTQGDFAEKIDIKRSLVGAYEEGRADPRLNNLLNMSKVFSVPVDLLISTDLTHLSMDEIQKRTSSKKTSAKILSITVDRNNDELIDLIPQKASAGYLNGYADPEYLEEMPKFQLPNLAKTGTLRAFEITGDSMLPLKPGTIVVGKYLEDISSIKNGRCYVILSKEEGVVYKRVFDYSAENGKLFLVSDNKAYAPYDINAADVIEVWEAKAYLSMDFPDYTDDDMDFEKLKTIVMELQQEVIKLKDHSPKYK